MDCHTFCPSRMVSPLKSTRPSELTTSDGIGGALLRTLIPTPPRTAKEMVSTSPRAIHNFRYDMDESFQRCRITTLRLPTGVSSGSTFAQNVDRLLPSRECPYHV